MAQPAHRPTLTQRWHRGRRFRASNTRRQDVYRVSEALALQFIASFASAPKNLIVDLDHSEDACYGQQPLAFYHHHDGSSCYLPLMIFDGQSGALIAAVLRPDERSFGEENAMIMRRVLKLIRRHFPDTHILVRGDGHFSGPELMGPIDSMPNTDFIFGFSCNAKFGAMAEPTKLRACDRWVAAQTEDVVPSAVRLFDEFIDKARSWPRVTSLSGFDAGTLYEDIYCARGQAENYIKYLKDDLASARTSCTSFLVNGMRLLLAAVFCCMQRPISCTSNCAPRHCGIPRCRRRSRQRSSRNYSTSPCRSSGPRTESSSICQAHAPSNSCCRH